eukprot:UN15582
MRLTCWRICLLYYSQKVEKQFLLRDSLAFTVNIEIWPFCHFFPTSFDFFSYICHFT